MLKQLPNEDIPSFLRLTVRGAFWTTFGFGVSVCSFNALTRMPNVRALYAQVPASAPLDTRYRYGAAESDSFAFGGLLSSTEIISEKDENHQVNDLRTSPAPNEALSLEYWEPCESIPKWTPVQRCKYPEEIQVIAFNVDGTEFAFSSHGMCHLQDSVYQFQHGTKHVLVTYWAIKNRARVFSCSATELHDVQLAGITRNYELIMSIDERYFPHGGELPFDEIDHRLTDLAAWKKQHANGNFCATGLLNY